MPYLCRLERSKIERGAHVGHAWNTIKFYGDVDQEGQQKSYTVDIMHQVAYLYIYIYIYIQKREKEKKGGKRKKRKKQEKLHWVGTVFDNSTELNPED